MASLGLAFPGIAVSLRAGDPASSDDSSGASPLSRGTAGQDVAREHVDITRETSHGIQSQQ